MKTFTSVSTESLARAGILLLAACAGFSILTTAPAATAASPAAEPPRVHRPEAAALELTQQVEIRRTAYGVVHVRADNLRAAAFALAYAQLEDYGDRVIRGLVSARGELARIEGRRRLDSDARSRERYTRAAETYHRVPENVRAVLEGFAEGVNHYIRTKPDDVPDWAEPFFTGHDVAARDIGWYSATAANRFVRRLESAGPDEVTRYVDEPETHAEDGSNAWALSANRTRSGNAILLRNPHLSWGAGYYEAHITVPGELDFYGDFRIGGPFGIIGGFNRNLGWSTTNNSVRTHEIYAFEVDPGHPDHFLLDDVLVPISRRGMTLEYRTADDSIERETRESLHTPLGPVIHRERDRIYVIREANQGQFRLGEQWLRMMQAQNFDEWLEAMRIRARPVSNFIYADRDDNIFYVWNAAMPDLPHERGNDGTAFFAARTSDIWTELVPYEELPQLLNPKGGYVRNENDSPHFTNMHEVLKPDMLPMNVQPQRLRLRSQHGIELLHNEERFSLEDVVRLKHSMRVVLADRVKKDLIAAVRQASPSEEIAAAADLLEEWENDVARDSRGAVLFAEWWELYKDEVAAGARFRRDWSPDDPLATPRGLGEPEAGAKAFVRAVRETREKFGSWDVPWGEVHRVRRGDIDRPVGGASGELGAFRILSFQTDDDGKRVANRGDGWVLAVEFSNPPRAYSILGYGQSSRESSPHYSDQAEMFAENQMKEVAFTEEQIQEQTIRRYRPGHEDLPLHVVDEDAD